MSMSTEEISIRWYKEEDYEQVEALVRNLARLFDDSFDSRWFKMYMSKRLMDPVPGCYVAVKGTDIVVAFSVIYCVTLREPSMAIFRI